METAETNTDGGRDAEALVRQQEEGETTFCRRIEIPFALPGTPCCPNFPQEWISKAASHVCPLVQAGLPLGPGSLLLMAGHALHPLQRKSGLALVNSRFQLGQCRPLLFSLP